MATKRSKKKKAKRNGTVRKKVTPRKKKTSAFANTITKLLKRYPSGLVLKVVNQHAPGHINRTRLITHNRCYWFNGNQAPTSENGKSCWDCTGDGTAERLRKMQRYDRLKALKVVAVEVNSIPVALFK